MTVCNSCRYCEGLCAVFPAMEMRRAFSDGDLNYLANLCHGCGACYIDCQFSPPHEFNVNVPQTLAIARAESYAAYAWPRALCRPVRAQRPGHQPDRGAERRRLHLRLCRAATTARCCIGVHTGPGAFYRLMPHNAMAALFGAAFLYAIVALVDERARVLARHRRARRHDDRCELAACRRSAMPASCAISTAAASAASTRTISPTDRRKIYPSSDVLRLRALLRRDLRRDALSLSAGARGALSRGGICRSCSARSAASAC